MNKGVTNILAYESTALLFLSNFIAEPTCGERYIGFTMTVRFMCVRQCVGACVRPSVRILRTINSTIVDGFQDNLTQLFSVTSRCTI